MVIWCTYPGEEDEGTNMYVEASRARSKLIHLWVDDEWSDQEIPGFMKQISYRVEDGKVVKKSEEEMKMWWMMDGERMRKRSKFFFVC